jgi:putative colanic acid biosynthesis acetyltransferase WcaF
VELNTYNNNWFKPGKNAFTRLAWYIINSLFINSYCIPISSFKVALLRLFGAKVGNGVVIKPKVNIKYPWKLSIGDYSWIGEKVWIDNLDHVTIGKNCCLSQESMVLSGNHNYKKPSFDLIIKPIVLEDGSWMGAKSVVCPGVTLKENAIINDKKLIEDYYKLFHLTNLVG